MNEIAEVVFAYSPKNDDELPLTVGDKIEIIGFEEEGWWRGKLRGQIGVFPSNFVEVRQTQSTIQQQHSTTSNKLNSIFSSKLGSKTSLSSSNSLNTMNTSNNSLNNNLASQRIALDNNSDHTQTANSMEGHHQQHNNEYPNNDESNNNSFNERRPKPIRGVGYGDIFAAGARQPKSSQVAEPVNTSSGSVVASERLSSNIGNILQKPIPKKPPPPTPGNSNNHETVSLQNGSSNRNLTSSDQAPALPPKPSNQSFGSFIQQSRVIQSNSQSPVTQRGVREQALVIHAYEPTNDDELELKANDIINIIDKKSEDYGWWKGELNGKVGVFPDNFVQLITGQDHSPQHQPSNTAPSQPEWPVNRIVANNNSTVATASSVFSPPQQQQVLNTEGKIKSVFSSTPKGFSKELESNLEKHSNNPASFLSLKRNKLTNQNSTATIEQSNSNLSSVTANNTQMNMGFVSTTKSDGTTSSANGHSNLGALETSSPTKLNHITANRAKGPARRPPSSISNRRNQSAFDPYGLMMKNESPNINSSKESSRDEQRSILADQESNTTITTAKATPNDDDSTPTVNQDHKQSLSSLSAIQTNSPPSSRVNPITNNVQSSITSTRPTSITGNGTDRLLEGNQPSVVNNPSLPPLVPKTSQRLNLQASETNASVAPKSDIKTPTSASGSPPTSTPPWMVNLRKTNAERKKDPVSLAPSTASTTTVSAPILATSMAPNAISTNIISATNGNNVSSSSPNNDNILVHQENHPHAQIRQSEQFIQSSLLQNSKKSPLYAEEIKPHAPAAQLSDCIAIIAEVPKKISNDVNDELVELKKDIKKIYEELKGIDELKGAMEVMKIELRACQSATDNQRKYIKELVNNLADERKKIAAMQEELDRNLK